VVQAPGADLISKTGQVINQEGKEVKTDVAYNSPEAPRQTLPVEIKEIPLATKLTLDANGFTPKEFKIAKGKALTVALTGSADASHVLAFESPLMSAVYINVRPGETRAVTFNAPDVAGSYTFFCDFPGHRGRGEVGTMIVE
jgi:plastocyanin